MGYDLIGKRFGKLLVTELTDIKSHKERHWKCLCDCGNEYVAKSSGLVHGKTTQCRQCSFKQISEKKNKGLSEPKRLHGIYVNMMTRCYNSNYVLFSRYGGRGITVCDEWRIGGYASFRSWALSNGYSDDLTIERIDNNGGYSPDNCRWATRTEQANNRHTNRMLTANGETDTMANWSRRLSIPYWVLQRRLDSFGWSEEDALLTPYIRERNNHGGCRGQQKQNRQA